MELITRQEARKQGLKWYFTEKPCKNGHISQRQTANGSCRECGKAKSAEHHSRWYYERGGREKTKKQGAKWREQNPERKKANDAAWRAANADRHRANSAAWRAANPERAAAADASWAKANRARVNANKAASYKARAQNDPAFVMEVRMRGRLTMWLRTQGASKAAATMELVGCTREELVAHIEAQFLPGMTWENRAEWHIDHRLPCAAFDMLDPLHQRACFHYSNLQPLWGEENARKGAKHDPAEVAAWVARFSGEA